MFVGVCSENESCSGVRVVKKFRYTFAHPREGNVASIGLQDEQGKEKLQSQAPHHCAPVDLHIQAPSRVLCL